MTARAAGRHSEPIVFPPVIPAAGFLAGVVLERILPVTPRIPLPALTGCRVLGLLPLLVGVAGFAWMVRTMRTAHTPIHNAKTPTRLVDTGPFRYTRNPMYLFGSTAYAGLALVLLQPWSLALLPVVVLLVHFGVVLREEQFLEGVFGAEYERYKARVSRWL